MEIINLSAHSIPELEDMAGTGHIDISEYTTLERIEYKNWLEEYLMEY